jgi:hypothetical protein
VSLDASSWPEFAAEVMARFPALADQILSDRGSIERGFLLVVNGDVSRSGIEPLVLCPTDRLYVIAQIAGG